MRYDRATLLILTVLATLVTTLLVLLPVVGFREGVTLGSVWVTGLFIGALMGFAWLKLLRLWSKEEQ